MESYNFVSTLHDFQEQSDSDLTFKRHLFYFNEKDEDEEKSSR